MKAEAAVITIDGPGGSGKGAISSRLARLLGWHLLDSGALYRLVALALLEQHLSLQDEAGLGVVAAELDIDFIVGDREDTRILFEGREVSQAIRSEAVSLMASKVAAIPAVRAGLLERQRAFRRPPGLVADGRDMGTIVFPQAELKIFLTASAEIRAQRRYKQLKEKGENVNLSRLFQDIKARDERDSKRAVAPLRPATDAIVLDSTGMAIQEVLEEALGLAVKSGLTD